jgi:lipopolysaccharide assembly outer membrane protein LptD (OstA)
MTGKCDVYQVGNLFSEYKMIDYLECEDSNAQYIIEGVNIKQNQNTKVLNFWAYNHYQQANPKNRVITERGTINGNQRSFLNKNSKIFYNDKILTGDEMYYNQITGFGKATGNVTLDDPKERRYIKGGYGEILRRKILQ